MGTGIVFTFLVIAAVISPLIWLLWWGMASVGAPNRLVIASMPSSPARGPRTSRAVPQPTDMNLPRLAGAIAVCRLSDGAEIATCKGPDAAGKCPRALADGTVPCAGFMLSLPRRVRGSSEWQIPAGYQSCLVGSYEVFRQPVSAG
jgi:hypothetical protein